MNDLDKKFCISDSILIIEKLVQTLVGVSATYSDHTVYAWSPVNFIHSKLTLENFKCKPEKRSKVQIHGVPIEKISRTPIVLNKLLKQT